MITTDVRSLIDTERARLVSVLGELDDSAWATPSLCSGWTVRDVAAHLLMPYELAVPRMLIGLVRARFDFDRFAHRWAVTDRRPATDVRDALAATGGRPFRVPGAGEEGELAHLVCHAEDVYRPLGVTERTDPVARVVVCTRLVTGTGFVRAGLLDGIALSATDADWTHGEGRPVVGTTSALVATLVGRTAALDELSGDGVPGVRRLLSPPAG